MLRIDRPEVQVISKTVERAPLVEHPLDDVRLGTGEYITHVPVMLDDPPQMPLGGVATEPLDLLELIQDNA